ncbi:hypothetical protein AB0I16_11895 [Streptomyces sp. NPDC050703]|uniref:hypothetical protein n=1 Tax=Streptomyces sp. NPDC050703 TaxID=3157218 RepID=UPI00341FF39F
MTARSVDAGREKMVTVVEVALVDGAWQYRDLNFAWEPSGGGEEAEGPSAHSAGATGSPGPPKKIAPFASPRNGLASVRLGKDSYRVYYVDTYGGIIELALDGGHVRSRNLTTELGAPVAGAISPLAVTEPGNLAVHYFDTDNRPVRLNHTGGWHWHRYGEAPAASAASPLAAMVTADVQRVLVYYLDTRNHLVEVIWHRDKNVLVTDLSSLISRLPAVSPVSSLAAVGFTADSRRIFYLDVGNNPVEVAHTPGRTGQIWWSHKNLTLASGAPVAREGSAIAVALTRTSESRLYYQNVTGDIAEVENYHPTTPGRLADGGDGAPTATDTSALAAVITADDVRNYVFYAHGGGRLINLEWTGGGWRSRDLSTELRLPAVAHAGPMTALFDLGPRAYYLSSE